MRKYKLLKKAILVLLAGSFLTAFGWGLATGIYRTLPFPLVENLNSLIKQEQHLNGQSLNKQITKLEKSPKLIRSLIQVKNTTELDKKRSALIDFIWSGDGFPVEQLPNEVTINYPDKRYSDISSLSQIDKLKIIMRYGIESNIYYFHTNNNKSRTRSCLMIYHQGHGGDFILGRHVIKRWLSKGCDVLGISMPLVGMNNHPIVNLPKFGPVQLIEHNNFRLLISKDLSPISFFLTPVTVALNHALNKNNYQYIGMMGLSGGGWTTTVYSAIDPRINVSYPVAGSLPFFLRNLSKNRFNQTSWGDFEQDYQALYNIANYLELYVLGADRDRRQLQVLNLFDSCCFSGNFHSTYEPIVASVALNLGGSFEVLLDKTHKQHMISEYALDIIAKDFFNFIQK